MYEEISIKLHRMVAFGFQNNKRLDAVYAWMEGV